MGCGTHATIHHSVASLPACAGRGAILRRCSAAIRLWRERARQRRALAHLDDHLLCDIGLTRAAAARQCATPFWRAGADTGERPLHLALGERAAALLYIAGH
jgi:uncharacterized protein YjiS (DUF1127 family)